MQGLSIDEVGIALFYIGIICILLELLGVGLGILGIGGSFAFLVGAMIFWGNKVSYPSLTWSVMIGTGLVTALFLLITLYLAVKAHKKRVTTGKEGLIGAKGEVVGYTKKGIVVHLLGEDWSARAPSALSIGQRVQVVRCEGLILIVKPCPSQQETLGEQL